MTRQYGFDVPAEDLRIHTAVPDGAGQARLHVRGELDCGTAHQLSVALTEALAVPGTGEVEIDLRAITFLDAAGARCLLTCRQAADHAGVRMRLCNPAPEVMRVLAAVGLLDCFTFSGAVPDHSAPLGGPAARSLSTGYSSGEFKDLLTRSERVRRQAQETRADRKSVV